MEERQIDKKALKRYEHDMNPLRRALRYTVGYPYAHLDIVLEEAAKLAHVYNLGSGKFEAVLELAIRKGSHWTAKSIASDYKRDETLALVAYKVFQEYVARGKAVKAANLLETYGLGINIEEAQYFSLPLEERNIALREARRELRDIGGASAVE